MGRAVSPAAWRERERLRRKNIADYFLRFSEPHREWLHQLADAYKKRGVYPMLPVSTLPLFYENRNDREIAAFAGLLLKVNCCYDQIEAFHEMLGDHPWEWFDRRDFTALSLGDAQNSRTGGILNWRIANFFEGLYFRSHSHDDNGRAFRKTLGLLAEELVSSGDYSWSDALLYLLTFCRYPNEDDFKIRLLLQVLGSSDGMGLGLWSVDPAVLKCPLIRGMREFVQTWFPDYKRYGDLDDAIGLFGFEKECDFFYAYLGYRQLQKKNPKKCHVYATRYIEWYNNGMRKRPYLWREVQPKIVL